MGKYILKRIAYMLIVIWAVSLIAFVLLRAAPSDAAVLSLPDTATPEQIEAVREEMGLNDPYIVQYARYMFDLVRGDLGTSIMYGYPCSQAIMDRLPATFNVALTSAVLILFISIPLGITAGVKQGTWIDFIATFFVVLLQSMAVVWVCILLLLIFTVKFDLLPAMGYQGLSHPEYLVMPIIASGYRLLTSLTRMGRSGMIDVLGEDYITCTYARGMSRFDVYTKYAFKNALIPIITIYGLNISTMLSGAVVIETVFNIPGIGTMLVNAANHRDYPLVQSTLIVTAVIFAVITLIVDIVNAYIDRRMQLN